MLGINPRASCKLDKLSISWATAAVSWGSLVIVHCIIGEETAI